MADTINNPVPTVKKNVDMLVEICAWTVGWRDIGFSAEKSMERICEALVREGYMRGEKTKKGKRNG